MPNHTHSTIEVQSIDVVAGSIAEIDAYEDTDNTAPTGAAGGGLAHNNMPPYQVCVYIIKAKYHGDPS
jgi:microcystin-dependent protein